MVVTWYGAVKLSIFTNYLERIEGRLKIPQPSFTKFELILSTLENSNNVCTYSKIEPWLSTYHFRCQKHRRKNKLLKIAGNTDKLARQNDFNGKHGMLKKVFLPASCKTFSGTEFRFCLQSVSKH